MSDDGPGNPDRTWLERISKALSAEPKSREDVVDLLRAAHDNQILDNEALGIMEGALKVSYQQVREIMIPRSRIVVIHHADSLEDILKLVIESNHSRFPVVGESADDIRGILLAKELLPLVLTGRENFRIDQMIRPATIIPESKRLNVLLREFREQRYHMAIVVDEYGGVAGLITIEDILEEIVGDIEDETDDDEDDFIRRQASDHYLIAALTPIEDFNEHFGTGLSEDEFDTVGGIVTQAFGHLPTVGETIVLENFSFRVIEADGRQIHQMEMWLIGNKD